MALVIYKHCSLCTLSKVFLVFTCSALECPIGDAKSSNSSEGSCLLVMDLPEYNRVNRKFNNNVK